MANGVVSRIRRLTKIASGGDAASSIAPPPTGTDPSSKRAFLALFLITMAIMAIGIVVAFTWENKTDPATTTPNVVVIATPT